MTQAQELYGHFHNTLYSSALLNARGGTHKAVTIRRLVILGAGVAVRACIRHCLCELYLPLLFSGRAAIQKGGTYYCQEWKQTSSTDEFQATQLLSCGLGLSFTRQDSEPVDYAASRTFLRET